MAWFNKKHDLTMKSTALNEQDNRVEVVLHKNATQKAIEKADEANQHLNDLLVENGFTLKIFIAAGGKHKKGKA